MEKITIPTNPGPLQGFFHPAGPSGTTPIIVICHGFCGSVDGGSSPQLADILLERGISTLRFSFSSQPSLSRQLAEIAAVIKYCRRQLSTEIALLGRSMGAAAGLAFAARDQNLAGLCLMAAPADLRSTFRQILGDDFSLLEQGRPVTVYHEGAPIRLTPEFIYDFDQYDLPHDAGKLGGIPLLVIHGLEDDTVPVAHGRRLYEAASPPRQLMLLHGVGHSFTGCADCFIPGLTAWLTTVVFPRAVSPG